MEEIKWQPVSERYTERQILSSGAVYHPADNSTSSEFMMLPLHSNSSSINYSFLPLNPSLFVSFISNVGVCVWGGGTKNNLCWFLIPHEDECNF